MSSNSSGGGGGSGSGGGGLLSGIGDSSQQAQVAQRASGNVNSFFSSLAGGVAIAGIQLLAFLLLKEILPRI